MPALTSRTELRDYCLRKLGFPVIEINIDDDQIEDRLDDAIQYFQRFNYDGMERVFLKHTVTQTDFDNKYITTPANIHSVVRLFNPTNQVVGPFDVRYQLALADMYYFGSLDLQGYSITMSHMAMLQQYLTPEKAIRFQQTQGKIYIDTNWKNVIPVGSILVFECWAILDPEANTKMYNHPRLKEHATALIRRQWGMNLLKYEGVALPGGVTFNASKILDEANAEITKIEEAYRLENEEPPHFIVG